MKLFISWSGDLSRDVATVIRDLFPHVLQGIDIFMSKSDIEAGVPWFESIEGSLAASSYGIIVVTRENRARPWLVFEAGALAKGVSKSRVAPLLVDLSNADLTGPLAQFHTTSLFKDDLRKLLAEINGQREEPFRLADSQYQRAFEKWWPDIDEQFQAAIARYQAAESGQPHEARSSEELLTDVLTEVRTLAR